MTRRWQFLIALAGLVCLGFFLQAGVICHVVDCSLPQPPVCPYHQPSPDTVKVCDEVAATLADLTTDFILPDSPAREFALTFFDTVTHAPALCAVAATSPPSVLRL